jgi:hypothetical protein
VATLKQKVDHTHFGFSQTSSTLHTTTTIMLQTLFKSTPPKRFANFKYLSHAAISSNTWQAGICFLHTCYYPMNFCLNQRQTLIITVLLSLLDQTMHKPLMIKAPK